jgi:RNA polymerase primary sigma factor
VYTSEKALYGEIGQYDLLTREEEGKLAERIANGDKRARDRMVMSNMRLALSIARDYYKKSSRSDFEDLRSAATCGLIKAVDLFDHTRGNKFSTYARWWIMQAVRQQVVQDSGVAKLPASTRQMLYKANKFKEEHKRAHGVYPSEPQVAEALGLSLSVLTGVQACTRPPKTFMASAAGGEGERRPMHELLPEDEPVDVIEMIDSKRVMAVIYETLPSLTKREEAVLRLRLGLDRDLDDPDKFPESNLRLEGDNR